MSNLLLYGITVAIWGTTWIAIEYQLGVVAPEVSVFYRYTLASAILFAWCGLRGLNLRFPLAAHMRFLLLGILLFGLNYILTYHAQQYITSALTAIVFSTMVWMNMLNSRLFFGVRSSPKVLIGSIFGIAGVLTLFLPQVGDLSLTDSTFYGAVLCVSAAFVASLGNVAAQAAQQAKLPIIQSNAWGMLYGAILTGIAASSQGLEFTLDTSPAYVLSLLYLAVFGSIAAFGAYLTLLGRIGAHRAGYAVVMFPVIAVIISIFFEGLQLTWNVVGGITLVLFGNVLILRTQRAAAKLPPVIESSAPTPTRT